MIPLFIRHRALIAIAGMLAAVGCSSTPAPAPSPAPAKDAQADGALPADAATDAKACLPLDAICTDIGADCCAGLTCAGGLGLGEGIAGPDGGILDASGGNAPSRCQ